MSKEYAINIADLTKDSFFISLLIEPVIRNRQIVEAEKDRLDGGAVMLECDEERAKAIVEIIRKKHTKNDVRCYEKKTNTKIWKRI